MKHELAETVKPAAIVASGAISTWWSQENLAAWVSIGVGLLTIVYILVQMLHLLRTWYMKERMYFRRRHPSDFMGLGKKEAE